MANNNRNYKEAISFYRLSVMLAIGLVVGFLAGVGAVAWRWHSIVVVMPPGEKADLKVAQFEKLWTKLQERGTRLESGGEILYGGGVGKLEPFD